MPTRLGKSPCKCARRRKFPTYPQFYGDLLFARGNNPLGVMKCARRYSLPEDGGVGDYVNVLVRRLARTAPGEYYKRDS